MHETENKKLENLECGGNGMTSRGNMEDKTQSETQTQQQKAEKTQGLNTHAVTRE